MDSAAKSAGERPKFSIKRLQPELAAKIKTAFADFAWSDTSLEKAYAPANQAKFVPISYQQDWPAVREIEERATALLTPSGSS